MMTAHCSQDQRKPVVNRYRLVKYTANQQDIWDALVDNSVNGTLLHTRKFLSYHGDKFDDQSLLAYDQTGILRAVLPAARDLEDNTSVVSHPGITYGGLIHNGWVRGQRSLSLIKQLCDFYAMSDFKKFVYKAIPWIYHRIPAQDDIYALHCLKADRYRIDLSATLDLENRGSIVDRRKRLLKKAIKSSLQISDDFDNLDAYWNILAENLKNKYNKAPVHSVSEIRLLKERFPQQIELITATTNKIVQAGSLIFHCPTLVHAQYFASSPTGKKVGALDLVVEHCAQKGKELGKRFFDFGISTDKQGTYLNDSLHTFKCEFGGNASVYEFYRIKL